MEDLELYIPKYKLEQLMPDGLQLPLKRIDDIETFENIIFSKYCTPMTRERADANPNLASLGVKSILIDINQNTTIWLVDETYSEDKKSKISIPGGHMNVCDDYDTVEELVKWNLIRELYEEISYNIRKSDDLYSDLDIEKHLKSIGCVEVHEVDEWYYQYTDDYIAFFRVIYISPNSYTANRNLVSFSLKEYRNLQMIRKYDPNQFKELVRHNMNVGHDLTSDIRTATHSRYSRMMPAVMQLVENLSNNSNIHYNHV